MGKKVAASCEICNILVIASIHLCKEVDLLQALMELAATMDGEGCSRVKVWILRY